VKRALLASLLAAAVAIPFASAHAAGWKVLVTSKPAKSMFQAAQAVGIVKAPRLLEMKATAKPNISTTGGYIIECRKGGKPHNTKSTSPFLVNTPYTKKLPVPVQGADQCTVTVNVQQNHSGGSLIVSILYQ
jgi:hypothetical protein